MWTGAPQLLWFDGPTSTALVLLRSALLRVALFPGARLVFCCRGGSALLSRAERGWDVQRLTGRLAIDTVLALPTIATTLLALGGVEMVG